jgi:polysaccharide export outer membrane protein
MIKLMLTKKYLNCLIIFSVFLLSSCSVTKKVPYFQDIDADGRSLFAKTGEFKELTIHTDDILSISIVTIDATTAMPVNQLAGQSISSVVQQANPAGLSSTSGFLVDKNGEIDISVVGKVKVAGLTTYEARELIKSKASVVYRDPNVQVRYANFK